MHTVAVALIWACVGFSFPAQVTDFLNTLPDRAHPRIVEVGAQYQVFYKTDAPPVFFTCPVDAHCPDLAVACVEPVTNVGPF